MSEPCRCFEDIEKALERIRGNSKVSKLEWVFEGVNLPYIRAVGRSGEELGTIYQKWGTEDCTLITNLLELADKVDPPKKKEREWRAGDVIEMSYEMIEMPPSGTILIVERIDVENSKIWYTHPRSDIGWNASTQKEKHRNLTMEAEMEVEK